ncbi:MAG: hypothetical protein HY301_09425 [Verrucomicrobia bacterium]|nr:hypothetical protein [Verrucomicrobiota bacterium]
MNPEDLNAHNRRQSAMLILGVRHQLDLTQEEFAEHYGIGERHERGMEAGDKHTSLDRFLRILAHATNDDLRRLRDHLRDHPVNKLVHLLALALPLFA